MKTIGVMHPTDSVPTFSDTIGVAVLAAGVGQAFDTPTGAGMVLFGADCNFFVRYGSTGAAVPAASSAGSSSGVEYNPTARNNVSTAACTGISIISPSSGIVTMSWFRA